MIVRLTAQEIGQRGFNAASWEALTYEERRNIASEILRQRPGYKSQFQAMMLELRNPNFNQFAIVYGPQ
jgi:hypothetical protein